MSDANSAVEEEFGRKCNELAQNIGELCALYPPDVAVSCMISSSAALCVIHGVELDAVVNMFPVLMENWKNQLSDFLLENKDGTI